MENISDTRFEPYLEAIRHNLNAPVEALPVSLRMADAALGDLISEMSNVASLSSAQMLLFAHSALRQATVMIMSGGAGHVAAVQRQALEAAMYGFLFCFSPEMLKHWQKREEVNSSKNKFRNEGLKKARVEITRRDSALSARCKSIYDSLLSLGAHPNVHPVEMNTEYFEHDESSFRIELSYLGNDEQREIPLCYQVLVSDIVLALYEHVLPDVCRDAEIFEKRASIMKALRQEFAELEARLSDLTLRT